ncbi:DUF3073 family protein [Nakamurella sp. YIM 132087]|uniref:DUF3073 family protein n=1 Tax=Nakamurella alba TaxID=2665158 RepID=A0A7K1FPM3_9ACTN|nr:DUF3073 domain-containing protein [Nakamurella alba]MTD16092.1 DUF3073 family protein [Nakamurella alba]
MGRGRQKAKQTKVARDLKYSTGSLDTHALERELSTGGPVNPPVTEDDDEDDQYSDYASYAEDDDEDEPAGGYASRTSHR